jgi:quaternary ammonium compound-resistance protein SugE
MSTTTAWLFLLVAGLFEAMWAIGLELSEGLSRPKPTVATAVAILVSMLLLAKAIEELPVGTAYAVWTGIGAASTALLGIYLFDEPATPSRLGFILVIVVGIGGLQVVSPS